MEEISLSDYIQLLMQRKLTIIAITLVVVLVAGIMLIFSPRVYESKTTLLFPQQSDENLGTRISQITGVSLLGSTTGAQNREMYDIILHSQTISKNVHKRLDLEKYNVKSEDLKNCLEVALPRQGGMVIAYNVPSSWLRGHVPGRDLGEATAQMAADIANTYVSELRIFEQLNSLSLGKKNRLFIESQIKRTKDELTLAENQLKKFQEAHPTLAPPDKSFAYADQARDLTSQQIETEVALRDTEGQLARAHATWKAGAPGDISAEAVIDNPAISALKAELAKSEVKRATLLENFTEVHPQVVSLDQEIQKTYDRIRMEVNRVVSGKAGSADPAHQELLRQLVLLEVTHDGMKARKSALNGAISDLERRLSGLPSEEITYARLLREVKAAETVYTTLLAEHAKARVQEGRDMDSFVVLDEAVPSKRPIKPRKKLTLAVALLGGLLLGIVTASAQAAFGGKRPA